MYDVVADSGFGTGKVKTLPTPVASNHQSRIQNTKD